MAVGMYYELTVNIINKGVAGVVVTSHQLIADGYSAYGSNQKHIGYYITQIQ